MRLNKYLSDRGVCARRKADLLISQGKVTVNGVRAKLGTIVAEGDVVLLNGKPLPDIPAPIVVAFHKPKGVITTMDPSHKNTILDYVKTKERLFPIGRLDVPSSGLLLLSNDGALADRLMHPRYEHEKEYEVTIDRTLTPEMKKKLESGVQILCRLTSKAQITSLADKQFRLIIHEGRNRQVRRMCEAVGAQVMTLVRIRVGSISLGNLKSGAWRLLSPEEYETLRARS